MSSESNLTKCKKCNEVKQRTLVGKFDNKNKRYDDENGKTWAGVICPLCHKNRIKENMKILRLKRKNEKSLIETEE